MIETLESRCIAMLSVYAGWRGKIQFGDVVVADGPTWKVALERMDPVARFRRERWL